MKTFAEKNWGDCSKAVAYQIMPTTRLNALPNENGYKVIEHCDYCGSSEYGIDEKILNDCVYSRIGYPLYINEAELNKQKNKLIHFSA